MDALQELALAVQDEDFAQDPVGVLRAWAELATGRIDPGDRFWPATLAPREAQALRLAQEQGTVTSRALAEAVGVSQERARQTLVALAGKGLLKARGTGKARRYTL